MTFEQEIGGGDWAMEIPGEKHSRQGKSKGKGHDEEMSRCI